MPIKLIKLLIYSSIFSPVVPLIVRILNRKYNLNPSFKVVLILICVSFISDFTSLILVKSGVSNYLIINIYYLCEILLTGTFFYLTLGKKWIVIGVFSSLFVCFIGYAALVGVDQYQHEIIPIFNLFSILFSVLILIEIFKKGEDLFIDTNPLFWFSIGILVYFSGSLFTDVLSKQILSGPLTWAFHNIANILKNILFAIGLWKVRAAV